MKWLKKWFKKEVEPSKPQGPQPQWAIGIYGGDSIFSMADAAPGANPVISAGDIHDHTATLVADPFMIFHGGLWHLFFEAEVETEGGLKGKIGHAVSEDGLKWEYRGHGPGRALPPLLSLCV